MLYVLADRRASARAFVDSAPNFALAVTALVVLKVQKDRFDEAPVFYRRAPIGIPLGGKFANLPPQVDGTDVDSNHSTLSASEAK